MSGKRILLCVSGGISAYKAIDLASQLNKQGWEVKCVLTENAMKFVTPINFSAITHNSVHTSLFSDIDPIPHITLSSWADLIVVAPATANIIGKAATGIADDLLSTILVASNKPVLFVPAMNVNMYQSLIVQENLRKLKERGNYVLQPETGMLACGVTGEGKYPSNTEVVYAIKTYLNYQTDLQGIKVLLTAGATIEAIDPMRFLSNRSSGKMGFAIARALALRGAEVTLIYGNIQLELPYYLKEAVFCESAAKMYEAAITRYPEMDWLICCAAVADYKPKETKNQKLPKQEELNLELIPTVDILAELGKVKKENQILVGFAAQSDNLIPSALDKYYRKNLDLICANDIRFAGKEDDELIVQGKIKGYPTLPEDPNLNSVVMKGDKFSLAHNLINILKEL
ncbi:MAG TPA: bifunctional phosphopantothenoylcysteine decarboxylase/phosphopantothenate--cysteine ligase CoaBC [Candidatus Cloacimonas sp.]|jgi:phosphopantothenoylcysteine decarboxylase/phosphopantothenate--cysteine ligase|nr:bifunctional phosphopantothenoylcysteine decarboxylase/phosphopantothenate--cysteine ligase CoaBC [Candidatus Cloacimonas sp.]HPS60730.1 bifunctional phosphopantothenoylcysteine decarboxylase/phosphopantothenate--cysteine ligase CoaBC [Candidatus Cloacimonas sp.]